MAALTQAGRAGRDGLPSDCHLYWGSTDLTTLDFIKNAGSLSEAGWQSHEAGVTRMQVRAWGAGGGVQANARHIT